MTILSNHRVHSYKSAVGRRSTSPKKMPLQKACYTKKTRETQVKDLNYLLWVITKAVQQTPSVLQHYSRPEPSAPPSIMEKRTIYVWDNEYVVELPSGFDIYEGLRRWYPELYKAGIEEETYLRSLSAMEEGLTDDEVEAAWSRQDYLEWLCD
jgi:hypothetical protein